MKKVLSKETEKGKNRIKIAVVVVYEWISVQIKPASNGKWASSKEEREREKESILNSEWHYYYLHCVLYTLPTAAVEGNSSGDWALVVDSGTKRGAKC